jgi:type IV pilus assembly protein PilQ
MNGFIRYILAGAMIASLLSCASQPVEDDLSLDGGQEFAPADSPSAGSDFADDEFSVADTGGSSSGGSSAGGSSDSGFSDFAEDDFDRQTAPQAGSDFQQGSGEPELSLDDAQTPSAPVAETAPPPEPPMADVEAPADPFADSSIADSPAPTAPPAAEPDIPASDFQAESTPPAQNHTQDHFAETTNTGSAGAKITNLQFKANSNGGTVIVTGDQPLSYTTRTNQELGQFIVEVDNANLPTKLKRSLNTKDMQGNFGAIDAYQNPGSSKARFVIQLRDGVTDPTVQAEGNSLLIMAAMNTASASGSSSESAAVGFGEGEEVAENEAAQSGGVLHSSNLSEFMMGNTKFYGKKISIETSNMDIRDALNFITEESGVNMVVADEVKGNISLKLRQVPWDQALVVIMRARKLGYTRQGNVLRIAPLSDLKTEEEDANKLAVAKKNLEALKVRMFPVSYARVDELEKKIKDFLGERGKVVGDTRTNVLVVTDIQENIERVAKLIASLDTQPPQVLIEGKIVEASDRFVRRIGVNWQASGSPVKLSSTSRGPLNMTPTLSVNPTGTTTGNFNLGLTVGTLDVLGNLTAALSLSETEDMVKVISSPRIVTMTNEKADINQTTEIPISTLTATGSAVIQTFQYKPLTLKLEVTPQVTADGAVIMKVLVNRQFQGANIGGRNDSFAINSREANTRVLVKNGETAVIGGIYQSDATNADQGVPWFKDIPVVGYLFKTKNMMKEKRELLIFITPRILGQQAQASQSTEFENF